jgi:hypothetical protein
MGQGMPRTVLLVVVVVVLVGLAILLDPHHGIGKLF